MPRSRAAPPTTPSPPLASPPALSVRLADAYAARDDGVALHTLVRALLDRCTQHADPAAAADGDHASLTQRDRVLRDAVLRSSAASSSPSSSSLRAGALSLSAGSASSALVQACASDVDDAVAVAVRMCLLAMEPASAAASSRARALHERTRLLAMAVLGHAGRATLERAWHVARDVLAAALVDALGAWMQAPASSLHASFAAVFVAGALEAAPRGVWSGRAGRAASFASEMRARVEAALGTLGARHHAQAAAVLRMALRHMDWRVRRAHCLRMSAAFVVLGLAATGAAALAFARHLASPWTAFLAYVRAHARAAPLTVFLRFSVGSVAVSIVVLPFRALRMADQRRERDTSIWQLSAIVQAPAQLHSVTDAQLVASAPASRPLDANELLRHAAPAVRVAPTQTPAPAAAPPADEAAGPSGPRATDARPAPPPLTREAIAESIALIKDLRRRHREGAPIDELLPMPAAQREGADPADVLSAQLVQGLRAAVFDRE